MLRAIMHLLLYCGLAIAMQSKFVEYTKALIIIHDSDRMRDNFLLWLINASSRDLITTIEWNRLFLKCRYGQQAWLDVLPFIEATGKVSSGVLAMARNESLYHTQGQMLLSFVRNNPLDDTILGLHPLIDYQDIDGMTILMEKLKLQEYEDAIRILRHGGDAFVRNNLGLNAIDLFHGSPRQEMEGPQSSTESSNRKRRFWDADTKSVDGETTMGNR